MAVTKYTNLKKESVFTNQLNVEHQDCPRCGSGETILCVIPLKGTSRYVWKRYCINCDLIWPI